MASLIEKLVSGVVKSAVSEILKKTGTATTKRTKRRTRKKETVAGGILESVIDAALGKKPVRKQKSRRRTAAARSKQRTR